eukprot:21965-Alexandrium_andersonii.AAC.1
MPPLRRGAGGQVARGHHFQGRRLHCRSGQERERVRSRLPVVGAPHHALGPIRSHVPLHPPG